MPLVSVIIPVYNPGLYLKIAVESVIAQTMTDWELIVVDDGSPEDVSYIAEEHPSIKLIRQENQGQSAARNYGIAHATGEFIAFLDQDDVWLPSKLERQTQSMTANPRAGLCHTQFDLIDASGRKTGNGFGRWQSYPEMLVGSGICGATTVMVRRSCLTADAFSTDFEPAEDYALWLRLARDHETEFVPSCEALYRWHEANQSHRYRDTYLALLRILQCHLAEAETKKNRVAAGAAKEGMRCIRPTYSNQAFNQARESLRQHDPLSCVTHLCQAIRLSPRYVLRVLLLNMRGTSQGV